MVKRLYLGVCLSLAILCQSWRISCPYQTLSVFITSLRVGKCKRCFDIIKGVVLKIELPLKSKIRDAPILLKPLKDLFQDFSFVTNCESR